MSEFEFDEVTINDCSPVSQPQLGRDPVRMICPVCSQEMTTKVERKPSIYAWITGIALFCFGCVICSCIPCCMETFEETKHFCSNCDALIGTAKPQF